VTSCGKRGRGSENKAEAAVALQLDAGGRLQFLKMQIVPDAKGETLLAFAEKILLEAVQSIVMLNRRHNKKPVFDHLLACSVWAPYKTIAELGT
jgi:hypothetical protein